MLLRKLEILAVLEMSRRKVGIRPFYASSSSSRVSIHCGLETPQGHHSMLHSVLDFAASKAVDLFISQLRIIAY